MGFREMFHVTPVKHLRRPASLISSGSGSWEDDVDEFVWISPLWIPIVAIIGGITLAIVKSISWARVRELEVRERIAMIEKGLIPPPETDPRGFDRAMGAADFMERRDRFEDRYDRWSSRAPERHRRAGVTLMGVGFGLMLMLCMLAEGTVGLGVGGFLVLLGLAFFINGIFERRDRLRYPPATQPPPPPSPPYSAGADLNAPRS
jgi:uncharacterized protein DUF6249